MPQKTIPIFIGAESLFVFFLIVVFFILGKIAVFGNFLFLVFIVLVIIQIFGDDIQVDGMDLRHFQFGLALWATQNLAFFDLIFVDVDLGGTFRAADHDPSSVRDSKGRRRRLRAPLLSVLYNGVKSTPSTWAVAVYV